jgi:hypothetical protein
MRPNLSPADDFNRQRAVWESRSRAVDDLWESYARIFERDTSRDRLGRLAQLLEEIDRAERDVDGAEANLCQAAIAVEEALWRLRSTTGALVIFLAWLWLCQLWP